MKWQKKYRNCDNWRENEPDFESMKVFKIGKENSLGRSFRIESDVAKKLLENKNHR